MWLKKGQYISIKDKSASAADNAEKKYKLFSPLIQISGPRRGRSWKPSRGILIQKGSASESASRVDLRSIFTGLVYGISFLIFAIGNLFKNQGRGGQLNGGQV